MHPEKVLCMVTEKSLSINDIPGGGIPDFSADDARHALGRMKKAEFDYCQYVFLLYGDKQLSALTEDTIKHIIKHHPEIEHKKDSEIFIKLCRMACIEQTKPAGKISHVSRYEHLRLTRHEWRYNWEWIFSHAVNYLNELQEGVKRHICFRTKQG